MKTKKDAGNALKQALERRQTERLSSNFSFRMMDQIRQEAVRQQKRKERALFISLIATVIMLVVGVGSYLFFFMKIHLSIPTVPNMELPQASSPLISFYCYIALLAFVLVAIDYWLRRKRTV